MAPETVVYRPAGACSIALPPGSSFAFNADGSLTLSVESACTITLSDMLSDSESAVVRAEVSAQRASAKRRSVGTPGGEAGAEAPAAPPRRRTRSRTGAAEEQEAAAAAAVQPSQAADGDGGASAEPAAAAATPEDAVEEATPAQRLAAAEEAADAEEWRWRGLAAAPSLPRWGHSVTRVGDGQLFILGGENHDDCFDSGHVYKQVATTWTFEPMRVHTTAHRNLTPRDVSERLLMLTARRARVRLATARGTQWRRFMTTWRTATRKRTRRQPRRRKRRRQSCSFSEARP